MSTSFNKLIDIFFAKEKCEVCNEEFDSIMLQHPRPLDVAHLEYAKNRRKEKAEIEKARKSWDELVDPLNRWLSKECPTLEAAREFVYKWFIGTHEFSKEKQAICFPEDVWLSGTMRATAYLVSRVLEGYDDNTDVILTGNYLTTEYGSDLYHAMCGGFKK